MAVAKLEPERRRQSQAAIVGGAAAQSDQNLAGSRRMASASN